MSTALERVRRSLNRCIDEVGFFGDFYLRFLQSSPEVAAKFKGVDMDQQALMLRASLDLMIPVDANDSSRGATLVVLARLHGRQGADIPAHLYDLWLESLLETIRDYDPEYDEGLKACWIEVLQAGIAFMKAKA